MLLLLSWILVSVYSWRQREGVSNFRLSLHPRLVIFLFLDIFWRRNITISLFGSSYRSTIPIQYSPKDIAMAALFLSASVNYGEKPLKRDGYEREWIELFSKDITAERLLGKMLHRLVWPKRLLMHYSYQRCARSWMRCMIMMGRIKTDWERAWRLWR